jgi:hypothetical protein
MEQIKMNMISTGAFLNEMDASDKQKNSLVNKLVTAWEQKNSKTARAGGVSLMALSLAACGSGNDDGSNGITFSEAQVQAIRDAAAAQAVIDNAAAAAAATAAANAANDAANAAEDAAEEAQEAADNAAAAEVVAASLNYVLTNSSNQTTGGADNFTGGTGVNKFLARADGALDNGDVLDGGDGIDTLIARFAVDADKTINTSIQNIEIIHIDFDDADTAAAETLTINTGGFVGLTNIGTDNADSTSGSEDITSFTNVAAGVGIDVINGDLNSKITVGYKTTTGITDASTVTMTAGLLDTLTMAGIETININAVSGTNTIETLTTTAATKLDIGGEGKLTLSNVDDATITIDASDATGNVSIDGVGAVNAIITGGKGDDKVAMGTTLTAKDTIVGGDGKDTLVVGQSHTAALAGVTEIETVEVKVADIGDGNTTTLSGAAFASATKFVLSSNTGTDGDEATVAVTNIVNGDEISITTGGADTTSVADGVAVTLTQVADTTADAYTLSLEGIGAVSADATNDTGLATVTVDSVETLTVNANKNATGAVKANGVEVMSVQAATSLVIKGAGDLDIDAFTNTTKLVSLDASEMTGKLTIDGLDSSKIAIKAAGSDTILSMAGLNSDDSIVGGAGTKDYVTATAVTGLTATTGKLNIQDVETVELNATGANTIDTSLMTGVNTLAISGANPGTTTITNLAATGVKVSAGDAAAEFDAGDTLSVALADETGASDSVTILIDNTGGTATDVAVKSAATLEKVTLSVVDPDTGNNAAATMTASKAATVVVDGGFTGAILALGTLANETTTVDLASYNGEVSFTAGTTVSGMTVTASSSHADDNYTLSAKGDTITVGKTGAVDVDIDGAGGTDTLNLTTNTGFIDSGLIDNVENINFIVTAGTDVTLGGNTSDTDGMDDAAAVTITGGNELSTFTVDTTDALAGTTLLKIDASAFEGNIDLNYAADAHLETMVITGGKLTTDIVTALHDTSGEDGAYQLTAVEKLELSLDTSDDGSETYTTDLQKTSGLTTLAVESNGAANTYNVDNYVDSTTLQFGTVAGTHLMSDTVVVVNGASVSGAADTINLKLLDTQDDTTNLNFDAAGIEKLNISLTTDAETHGLDLAGVTATTGSTLTVTVTGGVSTDGLTISDGHSTMDTIDASALKGTLTVSGRDSSQMTITGGSAADSIRMEHENDVLDGGAGSAIDDTLVVAAQGVVGGFVIDLSNATDQVSTFGGGANAAIQKGFEDADLSNVTGSYGAVITAAATGSTITGTKNVDVMTMGAKADIVKATDAVTTATTVSVDVVKSFTLGSGGDNLTLSMADIEALTAVTDLVTGTPTTSIAAGAAGTIEDIAKGTAETLDANDDVVVLTGGTYTSLAAALTDMEGGGTSDITFGAAPTAKDAFIFIYSDGTDAFVSVAATTDTNAIIATNDLTGFNLVKLEGISSIAAGDVHVDNITFVA